MKNRGFPTVILHSIFAVALLAFVPAAAPAQETLRAVAVVVPVWAEPESKSFAEPLAGALTRELTAAGFRAELRPGSPAGSRSDADIAAELSAASGARWTAVARCEMDGRRLVWRASVYDALDGAMVASDSQGAFPGLSALPLLDQSAAATAREAWNQRARIIPGEPLEYRLRFSSSDEGAAVSFGTGEGSRKAGLIEGGALLAPFTAFRAGDPVVVTAAKEGFWPHVTVFQPGLEDEVLELPRLMPRAKRMLSLGISTTRILGVQAEYRHFLADDAVFLRAADSLWLQYTFTPGSIPVLHDELRLGAGAYLFLPRDSRFRIAVMTGFSGIFTLALPRDLADKFYFDATFDAFSLALEWHTPGAWMFFLEQRYPYSLGLDSGLLARGWVQRDGPPMILTAGVMKRW